METVFGKFYERLDKPFSITYITSFVLFNWKFFYILLTTYVPTPENLNRLDFALTFFYDWYSFLLPLVVTLIIILLVPFFNWGTVIISTWFNGLEKTHISKKDADLYRDNLNYIRSIKESQVRELDQLKQIEQLVKDKFSIREALPKPEMKVEDFYRGLNNREKRELAKILLILNKLNYREYELSLELIESKDGFIVLTDFAKSFLVLFNEEDKGMTDYDIIKK